MGALKKYNLTPAQRAMAELQADSERARSLASWLVDHLARQRVVNIGPGVDDPMAALKQAIKDVRNENPSLARCEFAPAPEKKVTLLSAHMPPRAGRQPGRGSKKFT